MGSNNKDGNTTCSVKETLPQPHPCSCCQCCQERTDSFPKMITEMLSQFSQGIVCSIEDRFQKVVEKLVQNSCLSCRRSVPDDAKSSASRSLKLHFVGSLADELITSDCIKTEGASLMVELHDNSGSRVEIGPESSVKIKIFVLDGDFEIEDRDDWTAEEFNKNIAQPRKDKGPILKGKCEIVMKNGLAVLEDLAFTDNSKSMRNGRFRLGARVVRGLPEGVEIRDAVSKAFKVKERRVKFYRRHKTLSLKDGPECLIHIGKTFAQKLAAKNIHTVQDFLQLYHTDKQSLENILHLPDNKWSELIKNAESCLLTQEVYKLSDNVLGITLVLDCVFNIKAVVFKGTIFKRYAALDNSEKELANKIRRNAYEKRNELQESHTPIMTPTRDEFGSMSSVPHSSARLLDGMEANMEKVPVNPGMNKDWRGEDISRIPPNQAHLEFYEEQNKLQESHTPITTTPIEEEFRSPSSTPCRRAAKHPEAMAADMATSPIITLVDSTIDMERGGQEIYGAPLNQTCQGEEGLPLPSSSGRYAEVGHMMSNYNQVHQTALTSSEPQLLVNQHQVLSSQYQNFPASPNAEFFSGVDAYFDDMLHRMTGEINTEYQQRNSDVPHQDIFLQSTDEVFDSSYYQVLDSNQTFNSSPSCTSLKRPRFD